MTALKEEGFTPGKRVYAKSVSRVRISVSPQTNIHSQLRKQLAVLVVPGLKACFQRPRAAKHFPQIFPIFAL